MNNSRGSQWLSAGSIAALARNGGQTCRGCASRRGGREREGLAQGWGSAINQGEGLSQCRAPLHPSLLHHCAWHRDPVVGLPCPHILVHPVPHHAGVLGWGRYHVSRARCPPFLGGFAPVHPLLPRAGPLHPAGLGVGQAGVGVGGTCC